MSSNFLRYGFSFFFRFKRDFFASGTNGIKGLPEDPDELSCAYPIPIKIIEKNKIIIYLLE